MLYALVLGAAAGGGFPQWNSNDGPSWRARAGDPNAHPQSQSSIAVSADGVRWIVLNASPDLRQQINDRRQLHPSRDGPKRCSPIAAVVLSNADVDHVTGLLSLRESQAFAVYGHQRVLNVLAANSIFNVLNPEFVERRALPIDQPVPLTDRAGSALGITIKAFTVPGKIALWLEQLDAPGFGTLEGDTIGLEIWAEGSPSLFYIPGCSEMPAALADRLRSAAVVFFDGTLWRDDEMIAAGLGVKTGRRMGHLSCSGDDGTISAFAGLDVGRKIFIHINNSNPLLLADSPERREAEARGWEVAYDGMEIVL